MNATIEWSREDSDRAIAEGWDIFYTMSAGHEPYELERIDFQEDDSPPPFDSDYEAWRHVVILAENGSEFHMKALLFLREHSPVEHDRVMRGEES